MNMRVDVVASPLRYRRMPLVLLLIVAVLPAIGLLAGHRWLVDEADRYDESRDEVAALEGTTDNDRPDLSQRAVNRAAQRAVLATPMFDYRRMPERLAGAASANRLADQVASALPFLNDTSCAAVSVDGVDVGAVNENVALVPASTVKLIVGAVAIELLGADFVYETVVRAPIVVDGEIDGDVYLVGGGDPLLTSDDYPIEDDDYPAFATTSLDALADAFVANGVERIRGSVLGDGSRYDDEFFVDTWGEGVAVAEAGPYDALLVNDSRVRGRTSVQDEPNEAAARELVRLLGNRGIRVDNGWGIGQATPATNVIGTVRSAPLAEVVREMLTNSDNNTAEMLLKEIGVADSGIGSRFAGLTALDAALRSWGISLDGVRILDGSGLTPTTEMTCSALLDVLQHARGTSLPTSLPIAGRTGTLRDEFVESDIAGRLFAKTGSLGNPPVEEPPLASKALAGYVSGGADGGTIEFVIILNADEISDEVYRLLWDVFAERFATFPAGPDADILTVR